MNSSPNPLALAFPFLKHAPELGRAMIAQGQFANVAGRTSICNEGETCHRIAFLLQGEVRVYKANGSGREITLYEIGPGDTCILTASCILSGIGYPANAVVAEPAEVFLLPAEAFRSMMDTYQPLRTFVHAMLSQRLATIMELIAEVVFQRMDYRLYEYLVERSENGVVARTHQRIANDLGTSREVVSRLLKDFEAKGSIRCGRNRIEVVDYRPAYLQ